MHDVAILRIASQNVGNNFAESLWEDSLVNILDGIMHIFLGGTHTAHHISVVAHNQLI